MTTKESNPKDLVGVTKRPSSTVSQAVMAEVGVGMLEGTLKYGRHNYRAVGVRSSVYYDATRRHIDDWWEGEDLDADSRLSHVTKAICSLVVLRDAMIQGKWHDDRPPKSLLDKKSLDLHVQELMAKYPNPEPVYTEASHPSGKK